MDARDKSRDKSAHDGINLFGKCSSRFLERSTMQFAGGTAGDAHRQSDASGLLSGRQCNDTCFRSTVCACVPLPLSPVPPIELSGLMPLIEQANRPLAA